MSDQRGVTLMEVVSCMVILSVLVGIGAPMVEGVKSRLNFHNTISNIVEELHRARSLAIKSNSTVVFNYTADGYTVFVDDGDGGGVKEDWVKQPGEQAVSNVVLGERAKIILDESTFTSQRTRFSRYPGIKPGSIVIQGANGNKSKVIINSIGRIRVEKI